MRRCFVPGLVALVACSPPDGRGHGCSRVETRAIGRPVPPPPAASVTAFVGVNVVPMDRERVLDDQTVIVAGGAITAIGPRERTPVPVGAMVIAGGRRYLMPGLADMHAHLDSAAALTLLVARGVTTVRNMWGSPLQLRWREEIEAGTRLGPDVYTAGNVVDGDPPFWNGSTIVDSAAAADRVVGEQRRAGYDFVKVYNTLLVPEYDALIAAARREGLPLVGHVPTHVPLLHALAAGQASIEHLTGYLVALQSPRSPFFGTTELPHRRHLATHVDRGLIPALVEETRAAGTWNCVTLTVDQWFVPDEEIARLVARPEMRYVPPWLLASWDPRRDPPPRAHVPVEEYRKNAEAERLLMDLTRELTRATGRVLVGTDSPNAFVVPGYSEHRELANLVAAGLTPFEALRAATSAAATFLSADEVFGTVAVGRRANLLLVEGDPLLDVKNAERIAGVMVRGRWLPAADLEGRLDALAASYLPPRHRFAGMPALRDAGKSEWAASFAIGMRGLAFGEERALIGRGSDGTRVLLLQSVIDEPDPSRDTLRIELGAGRRGERLSLEGERPEGRSSAVLERRRGRVVGQGSTPFAREVHYDQPLDDDALLLGPLAGAQVLLAERVRGLRVGQLRVVHAARLEADFSLASVEYRVERLAGPDSSPRFSIVERTGRSDRTMRLTIDRDGLPVSMIVDGRGGTVEMRREK